MINMKKIKVFTVLFCLSCLIFYIAGSVASASFLINKWDEVTRGTIAIFWVMSFMPIGMAVSEVKE